MADPTQKVRLGRTKLEVTRFGLGSAQFGRMYTPVAATEALSAIRRAYDSGVNFFDTSPMYGSGIAESRVGAALRELPRDSYVLSDKVGYVPAHEEPLLESGDATTDPLGQDFSYDATMRLVEGSLKRLGLERIDIMLIHDPDNSMDDAISGTYRALARLREEGLVTAIGAGMNHSHLLTRLAQEGDFDCFLMAGRYTLLDQKALQDLLPLAQERGIAIYIGGPFNSGILADPYATNATFEYRAATAEWLAKAQRIDAVCKRHNVPLKAAAIQFPVAHPAVVSVLSGARSVAEVEENLAMFRVEIPEELWEDLRREGLIDERAPTP